MHAALLFANQHPDLAVPWQRDSQYLVIVTVPDEVALISLSSRALDVGLRVSTWSEPDLDGQHTAVALEPGLAARRLCANLPLLGRQVLRTAVAV